MRVDERNLGGQVSSTAGRATESQRVQVDSSGSSPASSANSGDRVEVSSLAGRISQAMQSLSSQAAQRVGRLQQDYQAGRYQPDVQQISHAMTSELYGEA